MIGKLVEQIIEAGFNVLVLNNTKQEFLLLRISQEVSEQIICVDWALTREELKLTHEDCLLVTCEEKLQLLRGGIVERERLAVPK